MTSKAFKVWEDTQLGEWVAVPANEAEAGLLSALRCENIHVFDNMAEGPLSAIANIKAKIQQVPAQVH